MVNCSYCTLNVLEAVTLPPLLKESVAVTVNVPVLPKKETSALTEVMLPEAVPLPERAAEAELLLI